MPLVDLFFTVCLAGSVARTDTCRCVCGGCISYRQRLELEWQNFLQASLLHKDWLLYQ